MPVTVSSPQVHQRLIRTLLDRYYGADSPAEERGFISSHWQYHSQTFRLRLDADGAIAELHGEGKGTWLWSRPQRRLLDQACIGSHFLHIPHRLDVLRLLRTAGGVCRSMGLHPTLDVFRQVCTLALLRRYLPASAGLGRLNVMFIGDGYGVLAALVKAVIPNSTAVMVDIGKTLLFQAHYCQRAHPASIHAFVDEVTDLPQADFVYCPAERLAALERFEFDAAVSIASMQEMNEPTVTRYFTFLRQHLRPTNLFYCCNRERKELLGGEVSEFIRYPWRADDIALVDGYCPWHQYFFASRRAQRGPKVFGVRMPLIGYYDGPIRHRLARLAVASPGRS